MRVFTRLAPAGKFLVAIEDTLRKESTKMEQSKSEVAIRPNLADLLPDKERKRLEFEQLAKLLRRPQLTIACINYGAEIRQLPNNLKTA